MYLVIVRNIYHRIYIFMTVKCLMIKQYFSYKFPLDVYAILSHNYTAVLYQINIILT